MPYKEVWVDDADIEEFDDDDLIEELEGRGYLVTKGDNIDLTDVVWHFRNGRKKDALIYLERIYPELRGLSDLVV